MLELWHYRSLPDKKRFIEMQDLSEVTLVVPDLTSKKSWQHFLLNSQGFVAGPQILRAEDFWVMLLQRSFPEINIVSKDWVMAYLKHFLNEGPAKAFGLPHAKPSTLFKAINEFLPILAHPDSQEIMDDWFNRDQQTRPHWEHWYYLSLAAWQRMSQENVIIGEWASAYLLQTSPCDHIWKKNLIVDLGPEIRTLEVELFQDLSQHCQVRVLAPAPKFIANFNWIQYPYHQFKTRSYKDQFIESGAQTDNISEFKRFTGALAEVKFAIGQIRQWLNLGHSFNEIAIVAPDIEEYWPTLRWHLKKEQIPFAKKETLRLGALGPVVAWMARIKKSCGSVLRADELEISEFHPLNYKQARFHHHFGLWSKRPHLYQNPQSTELSNVCAEEFLDSATELWPTGTPMTSELVEALKKWLMEAAVFPKTQKRIWIDYLESFLNHQELEINAESNEGIGLYSLMQGWPLDRQLQIFLGCSESQLKSSSGFVSGGDVLSLQHHTGHLLAHPDRDFREYQLNLLLGESKEQLFTFAETNLQGAELVPSVFWLNGREQTNIPFKEIDQWPRSSWESHLLTASGHLIEPPEMPIPSTRTFSLSPASLTAYMSCPFRFYAEKGLQLVDPAVVDLDIDVRTRGSLQHRLVELLTVEPFDKDTLKQQLSTIVDQCLTENQEMFFSSRTQDLTRSQLVQMGEQFIERETIYRREFPRFFTLAREAWFRSDLELPFGKVHFRGKIDRVDCSLDHSEAVVVDYKNDVSRYHNASSWIVNLELQLLAYTSSVECGAVETTDGKKIPPTKVVAAHYFGLKDFSRKGFTLEDTSPGVVETPTSRSKISTEQKESMLKEFQQILTSAAERIHAGDFRAIPHPKTECSKCPWRNLCRSNQQNL